MADNNTVDTTRLWHPAAEEPDPTLDAYLLMQTCPDAFECFKYGGYNTDGGQTWEKTASRLGWGRWCYIKDILPKGDTI